MYSQKLSDNNELNNYAERTTAVWQNGGFSAKFNGSSLIELLYKTEHLCFDFRHFAKLQTVERKLRELFSALWAYRRRILKILKRLSERSLFL